MYILQQKGQRDEDIRNQIREIKKKEKKIRQFIKINEDIGMLLTLPFPKDVLPTISFSKRDLIHPQTNTFNEKEQAKEIQKEKYLTNYPYFWYIFGLIIYNLMRISDWMIEQSPERYIKQGNHYYSKAKKKLTSYQNDLEFMYKQLNKKFKFAPCAGCSSSCSRSSRDFQRAFQALNSSQRAQYYYSFTRLTYNILFNIPEEAIVFPQKKQTIQINFLNSQTWKWHVKEIQIDYLQRKITLINEQISINLRNYLMRRSRNKEMRGIVLESACSIQYIQTIRISSYNGRFEDLEEKFTVLMAAALRERISRKLGINLIITEQKSLDGRISISIQNQIHERVTHVPEKLRITHSYKQEDGEDEIFPTDKRIPIVFERRGSTFDNIKPKIESFNHFQQFQEIRENVFYNQQQTTMRKEYQFHYERQQQIVLPWICDNLMNPKYFKHWKQSIVKAEVLEQNANTKFIHQTYKTVQKLKVELYYIRTKYVEKHAIYMFDTPNKQEDLQSDVLLDYCISKIEKVNNYLKILTQCRIKVIRSISKQFKQQLHDDFLGSIDKIINGINDKKQQVNSLAFEEDFLSKINASQNNVEETFFSIENNPTQLKIAFVEYPQKSVQSNRQQENFNHYLKVIHCLQPLPKSFQLLKYPKNAGKHPFWQNQWQINEKGEMLSINLEKVKAQNSVLKQVLKNLGKNFLSGRSILNVSLPVTIFSTQTNLSNICKSYSYAPRLLQQAARQANPVDKMKYVVAFNISCAIIDIQMEKPFNPILGETYQAMIDDCPVFGEQISHHPPISATYMKGRGYRLHGQFQSKVSMGINSAVGTSDGIMNIVFEDSSSWIKYTSFSGQMSGLVIGDRKISLVGCNHFIDMKNRIYLRMKFGRHKGITQYCKYADGIEGRVVKVRESANLEKFWEISKEDVIEQYGYMHGRWTNDIFYDQECIFNSWKDLPYLSIPYQYSLQSDSLKRMDVKERINNNYEKAQEQKEDLQNLQRNDRRLREQFKGKR